MLSSDYAIKSYVNICNRALRLNENKFPFKQILGAAKTFETGKKIKVQIARETSIDSYIFSIEGDKIIVVPYSKYGDCQCNRKWHIEWAYLQEVLKDPEKYIQNPAKINWDWIFGTVN